MATISVPNEVAAYIAGFFDGEGCIHLRERPLHNWTNGKFYRHIGFSGCIRVSQNVREPLELFQKYFGGNIRISGHPGEGRRNWIHYEWECSRRMAVHFLSTLLPYLTVKREEAKVAIRFFGTFRRGHRLTETDRESRHAMIRDSKIAKNVGHLASVAAGGV